MYAGVGAEIAWLLSAGGSKSAFDLVGGATAGALIIEVLRFRRTGNVAGRSFGMALILSVVVEVGKFAGAADGAPSAPRG